ncbi:MAG: RNA 2',3'-cyclic phosphodiesterase [Pseudomonadota bacterium]
MTPQPRRLFIGLMPDRAIQSAIQRHCKEWEWPADARPTRFGRYHITLQFLGDVAVGHEGRLRAALRGVPIAPLEIELCIPEVWSNRVAVLRAAPHDGLRALQLATGEAVAAAGLKYEAEHKFMPHVTLSRNAAHARPPKMVKSICWRVDAFQLMWSVMPPEAKPARYEVIERFGVTADRALQPPAPSGQGGEQLPLID